MPHSCIYRAVNVAIPRRMGNEHRSQEDMQERREPGLDVRIVWKSIDCGSKYVVTSIDRCLRSLLKGSQAMENVIERDLLEVRVCEKEKYEMDR